MSNAEGSTEKLPITNKKLIQGLKQLRANMELEYGVPVTWRLVIDRAVEVIELIENTEDDGK